MLLHSLDALREVPGIWRVVVSTDHPDIAAAARMWGADVIDRPPELATDKAPEWLAWQHLIGAIGGGWGDLPGDILLSAPTTSPLRLAEDLARAVERLQEGDVDGVISVTPANRNPYFNMVTLDDAGQASLFAKPAAPLSRRQDAPPVYDVTTVAYAVRASYIRRASGLFAGRVGAIVVPAERAVDIDSETDLMLAEALLARRRLTATE